MTTTAVLTVFCPDKTSPVTAIAVVPWEMGANLTDTSLSALGGGPDFSVICDLSGRIASRDCRGCPHFDGRKHAGSAQIELYGGSVRNEVSS